MLDVRRSCCSSCSVRLTPETMSTRAKLGGREVRLESVSLNVEETKTIRTEQFHLRKASIPSAYIMRSRFDRTTLRTAATTWHATHSRSLSSTVLRYCSTGTTQGELHWQPLDKQRQFGLEADCTHCRVGYSRVIPYEGLVRERELEVRD